MKITSLARVSPSSPKSTRSTPSSASGVASRMERRRRPRRAEDRKEIALMELAQWFVDGEARPHIVIDDSMAVLLMNEAARRFLGSTDAIRVRGTTLAFKDEGHRGELHRVINDGVEHVSFTARVADMPAPVSIRRIPLRCGGRKFLLLTSAASETDCQRMQLELGLTKAEAEIALSIFRGLSLVNIAKQRRASINTVKTQARYIFQKCRVHSKVALTRRIGMIVFSK